MRGLASVEALRMESQTNPMRSSQLLDGETRKCRDRGQHLAERSLDMLRALEAHDLPGVLHYLHTDVVWRNMPLPRWTRARGKEAARKQLAFLLRFVSAYRVLEITTLSQDGNHVYMERKESLGFCGLQMHVEGVSVLAFADDKVVEWRDYFDIGHLVSAFISSLPKQLWRNVARLF